MYQNRSSEKWEIVTVVHGNNVGVVVVLVSAGKNIAWIVVVGNNIDVLVVVGNNIAWIVWCHNLAALIVDLRMVVS